MKLQQYNKNEMNFFACFFPGFQYMPQLIS